MRRCDCASCRARHRWGVQEGLSAIPPWGHDVLARLRALEDSTMDLSGLDQAIADQKAVDDAILAKLDELITKAGTANAQGDAAAVQDHVVAMQQHIADVRAALAAFDGPAPSAPGPDSPAAPAAPEQPAPAEGSSAAPAAPAAPAEPSLSSAPADSAPSAPSAPASGGDAVVANPGQ